MVADRGCSCRRPFHSYREASGGRRRYPSVRGGCGCNCERPKKGRCRVHSRKWWRTRRPPAQSEALAASDDRLNRGYRKAHILPRYSASISFRTKSKTRRILLRSVCRIPASAPPFACAIAKPPGRPDEGDGSRHSARLARCRNAEMHVLEHAVQARST
jgi:hypothetical protein